MKRAIGWHDLRPMLIPAMTLRRQLHVLAALLFLFATAVAGRMAWAEWQGFGRAVHGQRTVAELRVALSASEMVSRERGPANGAMGDEPHSTTRLERLSAARQRSDAALAALQLVLVTDSVDARRRDARQHLEQAVQRLQRAREQVDRVSETPKSAREAVAIRQAVAQMASVIPATAPAVSLFADEARQALPTLGNEVQGALLAAELREHAGLLGSHFSAALTQQRPFDVAERATIERTRGRIDQLRHLLELRRGNSDAMPEVTQGWQDVEKQYFGNANELVQAVMAAGESDGRFGIDPAGFAAVYVPHMETMIKLRDLLLDKAGAQAELQAERARQTLWATSAATGALLVLLILTVSTVQYRLLAPLGQAVHALHAMARNDLDAPLPRVKRADEIAAVVGAVQALRRHALERRTMEAEREGLIEQLHHSSYTDFLTGLPNRRAFLQAAEHALAQSAHRGTPMSLVMLDVDRFKALNDTLGHAAGDQALVMVAKVLRSVARAGDIVARLGGEEFVALLDRCDNRQAMVFADRLRERLARTPVLVDGSAPVSLTASLGVADTQSNSYGLKMLLSCSDAAMYQAKKSGRNRVVAARPTAPMAS